MIIKDNDIDKQLAVLIIKGLIDEAEQENADFGAAIKQMSEEEFDALIHSNDFVSNKKIVEIRPGVKFSLSPGARFALNTGNDSEFEEEEDGCENAFEEILFQKKPSDSMRPEPAKAKKKIGWWKWAVAMLLLAAIICLLVFLL